MRAIPMALVLGLFLAGCSDNGDNPDVRVSTPFGDEPCAAANSSYGDPEVTSHVLSCFNARGASTQRMEARDCPAFVDGNTFGFAFGTDMDAGQVDVTVTRGGASVSFVLAAGGEEEPFNVTGSGTISVKAVRSSSFSGSYSVVVVCGEPY